MSTSIQPNVVEFKRPVRQASMMSEPDFDSVHQEIPAAVVAEMEYQKSAELAKTNKKLVTVVMGMTLLLGLVACLAYLAGRSITSMKSQSAEVKVPLSIVVDSPKAKAEIAQAAAIAAAPVVEASAIVAVTKPIIAAPPVAVAPVAIDAPKAVSLAAPAKGELYLQVGYVDKAQAAGLAATIAAKGFSAKTVAGDSESTSRVIIGPIQVAEMAATQARLMDAGFESFPRRF